MPEARDALGEAVVNRYDILKSGRSNWEDHWQAVSRYCIPRERTFTEETTNGSRRNRQVLDSTAPRSLEVFAANLHTLANNPATKWFELRVTGINDLNDLPRSAAQWLEVVEWIMLRAMNRKEGNVYNATFEAFLNLGAFGTSCIYVEEASSGDGLSIRSFPLQDLMIEQSQSDIIDAVFRSFRWTPRQVVQRWGEGALSQNARARAGQPVQSSDGSPGASPYIHAVFPSGDRELGPKLPEHIQARGAPFASVWVDKEARRTLSVGSFFEFPYMVPRWTRTADEVYGRSPAMTVLPDILMANRMRETILRGAEKLVDPPLIIPDGGLLSPVRLFPGAVTYADGQTKVEPLIPPGASRIEMGNVLLEQVQQAIRDGFFTPLFINPDQPVKTATQVLQERGERDRAISPMLVRLHTELYSPLILRVFKVLERQGAFPPPPQEIVEREIQAEYTSPLITSQREFEGLAVTRLFEGLAPWSQIDQGIFDNFSTDEIAETLHGASGAPSTLWNPKATVRGIRAQRAEQAQQEEAAAQAQVGFEGAEAAASLIKANAA